MRTTLLGFNQQQALALDLDIIDIVLMDYIQRANGAPDMKHVVIDDISYVWLSHNKIHEDLPILNLPEGTLKNRLLNLKKKGMVMSTSVKLHTGTMTYYSLTVDATSLTNDVQKEVDVASHSQVTCPRHSPVTSNNKLDNNKLDNSISINTNTTPKEEYPVDNFVSDYHMICKSLPRCTVITDTRRSKIKKILKKYSKTQILQVFNNLESSDFCKGNNDRGWKANIDFILREDKFVSVLEGKYNNSGSAQPVKSKDKFNEFGVVKSIPVNERSILNEAF